jgi:hypothetical protein
MKQSETISWSPKALAADKSHWIRAEGHGPGGSVQILSNPIYLEMNSH